jgi:hypothetical protein
LVSIDGDADLSALATKAELASGLADKLNLDTIYSFYSIRMLVVLRYPLVPTAYRF